jgi:hypothetical protein
MLSKNKPGKQDSISDQADSYYPHVDEDTPEVIVNRARIFQPKDENVSGQDGCIKKKQHLPLESILDDRLKETEEDWFGAKEVSRNLDQVNHRNIYDRCPTK